MYDRGLFYEKCMLKVTSLNVRNAKLLGAHIWERFDRLEGQIGSLKLKFALIIAGFCLRKLLNT